MLFAEVGGSKFQSFCCISGKKCVQSFFIHGVSSFFNALGNEISRQ